jgi:gamma-aminobutyric acid receptor subunit rho
MVLVVDPEVTGRRDLLDISDWIIGDVTAIVQEQTFEAFDAQFWTYNLLVPAKRIWSYYVWKVILPITLIVAMSWCVFWIDPSHFGTQIGLSATSMLTLIAFIFATTNIIPRLGYFTTLDRFIMGSTVIVFLALVQSVGTTYLVAKDKAKIAGHIDTASRVVFPLAFIAFAYVVLTR